MSVEVVHPEERPSSYSPRTTHIFPLPYTEHFPTVIQFLNVLKFLIIKYLYNILSIQLPITTPTATNFLYTGISEL